MNQFWISCKHNYFYSNLYFEWLYVTRTKILLYTHTKIKNYFIFAKEAQVYWGLAQCHMTNISKNLEPTVSNWFQVYCSFDSTVGCEIGFYDIPFIRQYDVIIEAWVLESNLDLYLTVPVTGSMILRNLINFIESQWINLQIKDINTYLWWGYCDNVCKVSLTQYILNRY